VSDDVSGPLTVPKVGFPPHTAGSVPVDWDGRVCHARPEMGAWPFKRWQSGSALTRQFAVLSFLVIGLITVALSATVSYSLRKDLLDREWATTADYVRTGILHHLSSDDFLQPNADASREHFEALYTQAVAMPEIVRVKLYDAGMRVVWSDEPRLIGERFADNSHLAKALTGQTVVNLEGDERKEENRYEGNEFARLVEVYVPVVLPGSSRVIGVVETYKVPTQVFASIRKGQLTVAGTSAGGGVLLYLSLFWIVRRASRRIDEQHRNLENRGRELARANEELTTVQGQLLEAERLAAIGEVVTAIAHGIRNPLANIRAAAQVAGLGSREGGLAVPSAKHLASIMAEVDRLESRLKELLQFVRPADRRNVPVDLNAVVGEAIQMVAGRMTSAQVSLTQTLAVDLPPVSGNGMLLEQVALSLLANAIEAMPNGGGTINVTTGADSAGRIAFVEVRDSGVGIAAEGIPKLFTAFYTTKAQGTGLGLAIAKKFTEAHGGTITVSSRPGTGATFRVTLPVHREV
jgi:two-component system sensor histidine kinase HydH